MIRKLVICVHNQSFVLFFVQELVSLKNLQVFNEICIFLKGFCTALRVGLAIFQVKGQVIEVYFVLM